MEVPPQESPSSSKPSGHKGRCMSFSSQAYHDSQEAYHHFDNRLATIEETNAAIQAPPHLATLLSNHDNNQLGGEGIPVYLGKYFFYFCFVIVSFL
jgi:hypothetical protein